MKVIPHWNIKERNSEPMFALVEWAVSLIFSLNSTISKPCITTFLPLFLGQLYIAKNPSFMFYFCLVLGCMLSFWWLNHIRRVGKSLLINSSNKTLSLAIKTYPHTRVQKKLKLDSCMCNALKISTLSNSKPTTLLWSQAKQSSTEFEPHLNFKVSISAFKFLDSKSAYCNFNQHDNRI